MAGIKIKCLMLAAAGLLLAGCAGSKLQPLPGPVSELHLLAMPVALNLDSLPGADGFAAKIYGVSQNHPKPVPIRRGTLEILMFDGRISKPASVAAPLHSWQFSPDQLAELQTETSVGVGYDLILRWQNNRPLQRLITIVARYRLDDGPFIYSAPSSITVVDV